jgi:hypothetical protein
MTAIDGFPARNTPPPSRSECVDPEPVGRPTRSLNAYCSATSRRSRRVVSVQTRCDAPHCTRVPLTANTERWAPECCAPSSRPDWPSVMRPISSTGSMPPGSRPPRPCSSASQPLRSCPSCCETPRRDSSTFANTPPPRVAAGSAVHGTARALIAENLREEKHRPKRHCLVTAFIAALG